MKTICDTNLSELVAMVLPKSRGWRDRPTFPVNPGVVVLEGWLYHRRRWRRGLYKGNRTSHRNTQLSTRFQHLQQELRIKLLAISV